MLMCRGALEDKRPVAWLTPHVHPHTLMYPPRAGGGGLRFPGGSGTVAACFGSA